MAGPTMETQFWDVEGEGTQASATAAAWGRLLAASAHCTSYDLEKSDYTLGRKATCDIVINDAAISNVHCRISRKPAPNSVAGNPDDMVVFLEDLSANGTFVNKEKLGRGVTRALKHGDEIRLTSKPAAPCYVYHDRHKDEGEEKGEVYKKYNFIKKLGSGACGEVWLGVNKQTGTQHAIKIIQRKKFSVMGSMPSQQNLLAEVDILAQLDHPNVIRVHEMFDTPEALYIVLELAKGGELFDRIVDKEKLSESETKLVFVQLLQAVKYLHAHGVAHRDLKPENILLDRKETVTLVKVTDFGLAKLIGPMSFMKTMCGTPSYQAPEVLLNTDQGYSPAVDLWSLGVILYICLCGFPPFADDISWNDKAYTVTEQIVGGIYSFPDPYWTAISPEAKDLVRRLLTVDVAMRITIDEALAHPFVQDVAVQGKVEQLVEEHAATVVKERMADLSHTKVLVNKKHEREEEDEEPAGKAARPASQ